MSEKISLDSSEFYPHMFALVSYILLNFVSLNLEGYDTERKRNQA